MDRSAISSDALDNLGSLEGYLASRGESSAVVMATGDPGSDAFRIVHNTDGTGPITQPGAADYVPQGAGGQFVPGAEPQTQLPTRPAQQTVTREQFDAAMAHASRMEAAAVEAQRQAIIAEDNRFLASISHLSKEEQDMQVLLRYAKQLEEANGGLVEEQQTRAQREEAQIQHENKKHTAMVKALRGGLAWFDNPWIEQQMMLCETPEQMDHFIYGIRAGISMPTTPAQPSQPQLTHNQVAANILAAQGRGANGTGGGQQGPKPGSGNIAGLIKSRQYVNVEGRY